MKYSEAKQGRIFVIRLEDGEILHECIEKFSVEKSINAAYLIAVGGADKESVIIVGPEEGRSANINPMEHVLNNVYEICGTGTLFPDDTGHPVLHMHIASGRNKETITGCVRNGVKVWHVIEIVIVELLNSSAVRTLDKATGFKLLDP